jgi:integrase
MRQGKHHMKIPHRQLLMARPIYGTGLRLQECLNLRIKAVDFEINVLTVK